MERSEEDNAAGDKQSVNPGFAAFQLAKALTSSEEHPDPEARQRAAQRVIAWRGVMENILAGAANYGSRTPISSIPPWATLEVATGGFATGHLLSGGPLQVYERDLLAKIPAPVEGDERLALNRYFLMDAGLAELQGWLQSGNFDVRVPEEGALLSVAWLTAHGHSEAAREIVSVIAPFFSTLRFYPVPDYQPRRFGARVHVQNVGATLDGIRRIRPNRRVLAQKRAAEAWAPLYDRIVALFAETLTDDYWPCQFMPEDWSSRASLLLADYASLQNACNGSSKYCKPGSHYLQLRGFLQKCVQSFDGLNGKDVARIRLILKGSLEKRGLPFTPASREIRRRHLDYVRAPLHHDIAKIVDRRLNAYRSDEGLDNVDAVAEAVRSDEASDIVPAGTAIPKSIRRKLERCLNETIEMLLHRGLISSGESLAEVLPQLTAGLKGLGIDDPLLRQLYAAIYRAFRRRRSLLLLNLEKQVQIEELPWIAAIEHFRCENPSSRETSRQALEEIIILYLKSFPHVIAPNKLVRELDALANGAGIDMPLVEELATDIFMGQFSGKFLEAAKLAGTLLYGSLYAVYFNIDFNEIETLGGQQTHSKLNFRGRHADLVSNDFAQICAMRAGVSLGTWNPATNGMIIEQQQILTTQNLAAIVICLDLRKTLQGQFEEMAKSCFRWICKRNQIKIDDWHAKLIRVKNTAYAWRQMIFFLSLLSAEDVREFLIWADGLYVRQSPEWQKRFAPALNGLKVAADGHALDSPIASEQNVRRFLGWSKERHWLLG